MIESISPSHSNRRVFIACLLSFLTLMAPLASFVSAMPRAKVDAKAGQKPIVSKPISRTANATAAQPIAPGPNISATLTDDILLPAKKNPGDTINYTAIITNDPTADATVVNYNQLLDTNLTLVAGSLNASPLAFNDTYSTIGNTLLEVGAVAVPSSSPKVVVAGSVLANDTEFLGDTFTLKAPFPTASTAGGIVAMNSSGNFSFLPKDGFTGADTFTYTITDDGTDGIAGNADDLTGTGIVTINVVAPKVWYVKNNAAPGGLGRSTDPFDTLAEAQTASGVGDTIYIFTGDGTTTNENGGIALKNSQRLIGEGVQLDVPVSVNGGPNPTVLRGAGSRPLIGNSGGNGVTLADGNTVRGLNVSSCAVANYHVANVTTVPVGTLVINNVALSGSGGLFRADAGGAVTVNFDGASTTGTTQNGIQLSNVTGTFSAGVSGNSIAAVDGTDVFVSGGSAAVTVASDITSSTGGSIEITGHTGASAIGISGDLNITGGTGISVHDNSGSSTIDFTNADKDVSTGAVAAVSLVNNTGLTINFSGGGLNINTTSGAGFSATGGGTVTVTGSTNIITSGTGTALNFLNTIIGGSGLTFESITANGATNGIVLNNTLTGGAESSGGLSVTGPAVSPTAGSGGTIQNNVQGAVFTSTRNLSLKYMNFTNANSGNGTCNNVDNPNFNNACQAAINMNTVTTATFDNLIMDGGVQVGINGRTVSNLSILNSTVKNFGDNVNENDVRIFNLTGTCAITNSTFSFLPGDPTAGENLVDIRNDTSTALTLNVLGNPLGTNFNTFTDNQSSATGSFGLTVTGVSSANITMNVQSSKFLKIRTAGIATFARGTSVMNVNITGSGDSTHGNTFDPGFPSLGRAIDLNAQDTAQLNFNINENPKIYGTGGPIINIFGTVNAQINGHIRNNPDIRNASDTIGALAVGSAIYFHPEDSADGRVEISGNTISKIGKDQAILLLNHGNGAALLDGVIDGIVANNTISIANANANNSGIYLNGGANAGDVNKLCGYVHNNAVTTGLASHFAFVVFVGSAGSDVFLQGFSVDAAGTWTANGNTEVGPGSPAIEGGDHAAKPAAGNPPFNGTCRAPTNAVAMLTPPPSFRDDLAQSDFKTKNEKPAPALVFSQVKAGISAGYVKPDEIANYTVSSVPDRGDKRFSHHAVRSSADAAKPALNNSSTAMSPLSGENVHVTIGTLPANKTLTIVYKALISTTPTVDSVSSQGTISGSNFADVLTSDPDPGSGAGLDATVTKINMPDLTIQKTHVGNFKQGDIGKTYTITPRNNGTFATFAGSVVTVTDTLPSGLTPTAPNGAHNGWSCNIVAQTLTCTRSDSVAAATDYPTITLTVDVASNAPANVTNTASVTGGGEVVTNNNSDDDPTTIIQVPDLTIDKAHVGSFFQGQTGAQYTITVGNAGPGPVLAGETITVSDVLPSGLTATAISGTNWSCTQPSGPCTRTGADTALAVAGSYPVITLTVNVANNAPTGTNSVTNSATVAAGAGVELNTANNTDNDQTTINAGPDLSILKTHTGPFTQGDTGKTYTITVSNVGGTASYGTVTVTDTLPTGLTPTAPVGAHNGWTCGIVAQTLTCTRNDALNPTASYPDITVTFDIATNSALNVTNTATVSGGGDVNAANNSDDDPTTIIALCSTPPANMIDWWTGDNTTRDIAGGHDGTLNGAGYAPGKVLQGFNFDGVNDYVDIGDVDLPATFTIDAWVNPTDLTAERAIVNKDNGTLRSYFFNIQSDGRLRALVQSGGSTFTQYVTDNPVVVAGSLQHVAVTYNGGAAAGQKFKFYVNGVNAPASVASSQDAGGTPENVALNARIGEAANDLSPFFGVIDEVEFFSVVLTGAQINTIFTAGAGGKCKPSDLRIDKSHVGNFNEGSTGNNYSIIVTNDGPTATSGTTTVVDNLPAGLTATALSGTNWTCTSLGGGVAGPANLTCTSTDIVTSGNTFPTITLTVTAPVNPASPTVTNTVTVSGGGELDASDDTDSDLTTFTPQADLAVTKGDSPDPVKAGNNITYTVNFTNNGPSNAQNVNVTDTVPANTTLVSASTVSPGWSRTDLVPAGGTGNVVFSNSSVASGGTATFTIVVKVNSSVGDGATITNNATASSTTSDPTPGNNTGTATTTVNRSADLEITKADSPDPVAAGSNLTYTLSFTNHGPSDASTVTVSDATPANTTLVSVTTPAGWTRTDVIPAGGTGTISFSKSSVANGETATFTIVLKVGTGAADASTINNSATTSSATTDPTTANNTGNSSTTVVNQADLAASKTDSPDPVTAGNNITYTIHVQNNGPATATSVSVSDAVPANTTFASVGALPSGWSRTDATPVGGTGTITFTKSSMDNGTSADLVMVVKVNSSAANGSTITNSATVSSATTDPTSANDTGTSTTTVATSANIVVTKTDSPDPVTAGNDLTYTVTITNNGPSDAQTVQFTDSTPTNTTFVSEQQNTGPVFSCTNPSVGGTGTTTCSITTLAAGASGVFEIKIHVNPNTTSGTVITNSAVGSTTTTDPTPGNNTGTTTTTVNTKADLQVTKTDSPDPVTAGNDLTYTVTLTNNGPSNAQTVQLTDSTPPNTTFVSELQNSGPIFSCTNPVVGGTGTTTCTIATLAAGATAVFTIKVHVNSSTADAATITNSAVASSATTDPTPANNTGTSTTTVNRKADLSITKTDSPDPVAPNGTLTYSITVNNTGPSNASSVVVTDVLPANVTYVSATPSQGSCSGSSTVTCNLGNIVNGGNATVSIVVTVNSGLSDGTVISNTASVDGKETDPDSSDDSSTATTTVRLSDMTISKTHTGNFIQGQTGATYTITVGNVGVSSSSGTVTVTDTLPASLTPTAPIGAHNGWTCNIVAQTLTCTRSDALTTGNNYPAITLTVNVSTTAPATVANTATVSGGGDSNSANNSSSDLTTIISPKAAAWTLIASTLLTDEDSLNLVALANFQFLFRGTNVGEVIGRANLTPTGGITTFCPAGTSVVKVLFTDSDGAATNAQVFFEIKRSNILTGGDTTVYTFNSDTAGAPADTALHLYTVSQAGLDFDFVNNIYWIEVKIKRSNSSQTAKIGVVQVYESSGPACP